MDPENTGLKDSIVIKPSNSSRNRLKLKKDKIMAVYQSQLQKMVKQNDRSKKYKLNLNKVTSSLCGGLNRDDSKRGHMLSQRAYRGGDENRMNSLQFSTYQDTQLPGVYHGKSFNSINSYQYQTQIQNQKDQQESSLSALRDKLRLSMDTTDRKRGNISHRPITTSGLHNDNAIFDSYNSQTNIQQPPLSTSRPKTIGSRYRKQITTSSRRIVMGSGPANVYIQSESERDGNSRQLSAASSHRLREGLSPLTKVTNEQVQQTLGKLDVIDQYIENKDIPKGIDKINCQTLIQQTNREIKTMNYKLLRVIATENIHQSLHVGKPTDLEVFEDQPLFCKVIAKGYRSPAIFTLNYRNDNKIQIKGIKVCFSINHKEPTESNCDKIFEDKSKFIYKNKSGSEKFDENSIIYLGIYSKLGCSLTIQVSFPPEPQEDFIGQKKKIVKIIQKQKNEFGEVVEVEVIHDIQDIEDSLFKMLKDYEANEKILKTDDFIAKNKMINKKWDQIKDIKLRNSIQTKCHQLQQAQWKKSEIEEFNRKKNYFLLHKWDILRVKKQEMLNDRLKEFQKMNRSTQLAKMILVKQVLKTIYEIFDQKRYKVRLNQKRNRCSGKIARFFKRKMKYFGIDQFDRNQLLIQKSFTFATVAKNDLVQEKSKQILSHFIKESSALYHMKQKFLHFYNMIVKIQLANQARVISVTSRIQFLKDIYWDREKMNIIRTLMQNKKQAKKAKQYVTDLNAMSDHVRDHFLKHYFKYCKLTFLIKFLQWRIMKLRYQGQEFQIWENEIPKMQKEIRRIYKFLFEDLDTFAEDCVQVTLQNSKSSGNLSTIKTGQQSRTTTVLDFNKGQDSPSKGSQSAKKTMSFVLKNLYINDNAVVDPGPPPIFIFMPNKTQMNKMILKAITFEKQIDVNQ